MCVCVERLLYSYGTLYKNVTATSLAYYTKMYKHIKLVHTVPFLEEAHDESNSRPWTDARIIFCIT